MSESSNQRLISLDVFRGITIAGMILVNNPGSWGAIYPPLKHAAWNGCTPTDLIFPFFLFIVGVAITLSLSKRKERGDDQNKLLFQIFRRSLMLFGLGIILHGFPYFNFSEIRIPGVLQRIAVVYLFSSIIFLKFDLKKVHFIAWALIIIYWLLMSFVPVPGVGYANLEPTTNLAAWLDKLLLEGHLWKVTKVWDPEGILSTVPAISSALFGILAGNKIREKISDSEKLIWMFVWGNILLVAGIIWDLFFPLNKSLWTSSYVLYTAGIALHFLAMCYWSIDVKKITWWTKPFVVYGLNAITVFFFSGILARTLTLIKLTGTEGNEITLKAYLYDSLFTWWLSPINASLGWAILNVVFWLGILWILYKKKIFIKV